MSEQRFSNRPKSKADEASDNFDVLSCITEILNEIKRIVPSCNFNPEDNAVEQKDYLYEYLDDLYVSIKQSSQLLNNTNTILFFIKKGYFDVINYCDKSFFNNPVNSYFILNELNKQSKIITDSDINDLVNCIPISLINDKEFILTAFETGVDIYEYISDELKSDQDILLNYASYFYMKLSDVQEARKEIFEVKENVLAFVECAKSLQGYNVVFKEEFQRDEDIAKAALDRGYSLFELGSANKEKNIVLYAIDQDETNALYVDSELLLIDKDLEEKVSTIKTKIQNNEMELSTIQGDLEELNIPDIDSSLERGIDQLLKAKVYKNTSFEKQLIGQYTYKDVELFRNLYNGFVELSENKRGV